MTIKELFFIVILELGIYFKRASSYSRLEKILYGSPREIYPGILQQASEVRLSTLLKHYYDGDSYSISQNSFNKICLTDKNAKYYFLVSVMSNFLLRKDMLSIDYVEFDDFYEGEMIIKPFDLTKLHKNNGVYYNNRWATANSYEKIPAKNMLMAVLSYVKLKMGYKK